MKLHSEPKTQGNRITRYAAGSVTVNEETIFGPIVVLPQATIRSAIPASAPEVDEAFIERLGSSGVQIILLGTGGSLRWPPAEILRYCAERRIGLEVMDSPAACRTFNILAAEGRNVAAALLVL